MTSDHDMFSNSGLSKLCIADGCTIEYSLLMFTMSRQYILVVQWSSGLNGGCREGVHSLRLGRADPDATAQYQFGWNGIGNEVIIMTTSRIIIITEYKIFD
jgi:hypothetical protein